jgi:hypothetical protein
VAAVKSELAGTFTMIVHYLPCLKSSLNDVLYLSIGNADIWLNKHGTVLSSIPLLLVENEDKFFSTIFVFEVL